GVQCGGCRWPRWRGRFGDRRATVPSVRCYTVGSCRRCHGQLRAGRRSRPRDWTGRARRRSRPATSDPSSPPWGVTQIDSVARVIRSHYLPFFSRLGPYQRATLDRLLYSSPRMGVEYWAHAAAFVPPETWKHFSRSRAEWWRVDYGQRHPETGEAFRNLQSSVLAALAEGPKSARDVSEVVDHDLPERHRGHWG